MKRFSSASTMASAIALTTALAACTNGQGDVDVSLNNVATFPAAPPEAVALADGATVTTDAFVTVDLQKDIESLSKFGEITAEISKDTISGTDLSFVDHVKATIVTEDGTMPVQVLADRDVPGGSSVIDLSPLLISDSLVLAYLSEGKVDIHFYITGAIPDRPVTLTYSLDAHLSVAVRGSVFKL
jgi:hypothetical protein